MTDTLTVRFNAPEHHELRVGDIRIAGGATAQLPREEAEALARNEPEVEIVEAAPVRGKTKTAEAPAAANDTKEDEL